VIMDQSDTMGSVLLVGNFLSAAIGRYSVCEGLAERLKSRGWIVHRTSVHKARLPRLADMVFTALSRWDEYDVAQVDVYSGPAFLWAEIVTHTLRALRKPFILILRGGNLPTFASRHPIRVRRVLAMANAVTTPSRYLQVQMQTYRTDLTLLPNPIDLKCYPYRERSSPTPSLAWLRAFHNIYNTPLAAQMTELLKPQFPDVHLTMYGPDKGDGSLEHFQSTVARLNVEDQITIVGPVPKRKVPQCLSRHDVFLNTTNVDNTPVSVMEAMALGMCVVSTDVGGIPYLLKDGHNALLVPPGDPEAMAGAVRRVLTEPGLASKLSKNARAAVEAWDWDLVLPRWEKLLQKAAEDSRG
jgi:glycosyltransferase involved in cell wall biosynthesis